jgi:two-component system, OmpR family, copper resistance phosphate regulon response regulator CusR
MQILLVEDEVRVADFLEEALRGEGYLVTRAASWRAFTDEIVAPSVPYDLLILDRNVDGRDTLTELSHAKSAMPHARVLFLSAINSAQEKAKALDLGADDYLAKPYSFTELAARVRVLLRRGGERAETKTVLQLGNLTLHLVEHQAYVLGQRLDLTNKEYQVLVCLLQRPGQVFNKYQLLDRVWDRQVDLESNVVEVTVKNLRSKLAQAQSTVTIENKRNIGYWIEK